jgi:uncharacterized protein YdiU (UPF0061 family)
MADYKEFAKINGQHPWQKILPEACVLYPVRNLNNGQVIYFNFALAKEMGLIPKNHPHELNKALEKTILDTFCVQIINDYDQQNKSFAKNIVSKVHRYMATRYLQLQHNSKTGKTSGDGRSIWNGCVEHNGKQWDVSSRGTGVTSLAPGYVDAGKPIPTGCTSFGYACGQADLDELVGSALMSEIFHRQGIKTERMLVIIKTSHDQGIGVRAALNLVRPAHIFLHLKQGNVSALTRACDFLIERQVKNKEWQVTAKGRQKYDVMLSKISSDFAKFAARLDTDYIFVWLDWDGDNVLANGGIIDYGSVRQFGIRHDQYRYDDVDRFSTTLNEQKHKAQAIVQVFAQAVDFIKTGRKKSLELFKSHPDVIAFEQSFEKFRLEHLLYRVGFENKQIELLIKKHFHLVQEFDRLYKYFERRKISKEMQKVPDGVNRPALFNMRQMMVSVTNTLISTELSKLTQTEIDRSIGSSFSTFALSRDRRICQEVRERYRDLAQRYHYLVNVLCGRRSFKRLLQNAHARSQVINRIDRITGNGVEYVVEIVLEQLQKNTPQKFIQSAMEAFIANQVLLPNQKTQKKDQAIGLRGSSKAVLKSMQAVLLDCKDDL